VRYSAPHPQQLQQLLGKRVKPMFKNTAVLKVTITNLSTFSIVCAAKMQDRIVRDLNKTDSNYLGKQLMNLSYLILIQ